jgi:hypothetical protein
MQNVLCDFTEKSFESEVGLGPVSSLEDPCCSAWYLEDPCAYLARTRVFFFALGGRARALAEVHRVGPQVSAGIVVPEPPNAILEREQARAIARSGRFLCTASSLTICGQCFESTGTHLP